MRRRVVISLVISLASLVGLVRSHAAAAGGGDGCQPAPATQNYPMNYDDGWTRDVTGQYLGGVYADIKDYSPWVSRYNGSSTESSVVAWVMLTDATRQWWAQVGWLEYPGTSRHTFEQTFGPGYNVPYTHLDPSEPINSFIYYDVLYGNAGPGIFSFTYNGSLSSDEDSPSFTPAGAQSAGETLSNADQMPGGYQSYAWYETFKDSHIWLGSSWQAFNGNYTNPGWPYGGYKANSTEFDIADNRCPN